MKYRYFVRREDNPESKRYDQPLAIYRFAVTDETVITEQWIPSKQEWIDNPEMIAFTGFGGATNFDEVDEAEAERVARQLGQAKAGGQGQRYQVDDEGRRQAELEQAKESIGQEISEGSRANWIGRAGEAFVTAMADFVAAIRGGPGSDHFDRAGRPGDPGGRQPREALVESVRLKAAMDMIDRTIVAVAEETGRGRESLRQENSLLLKAIMEIATRSASAQAEVTLAVNKVVAKLEPTGDVSRHPLAEALAAITAVLERPLPAPVVHVTMPTVPFTASLEMPDETDIITETEVTARDSMGRLLRSITRRFRADRSK